MHITWLVSVKLNMLFIKYKAFVYICDSKVLAILMTISSYCIHLTKFVCVCYIYHIMFIQPFKNKFWGKQWDCTTVIRCLCLYIFLSLYFFFELKLNEYILWEKLFPYFFSSKPQSEENSLTRFCEQCRKLLKLLHKR